MARIGILTISDRVSRGDYEDLGGPAIESWLEVAIANRFECVRRTVSDGVENVKDALTTLCDHDCANLVLTTGGTGPALRDLTPEAMRIVITKELPGFGELMRQVSLLQVPTAILSRQTAGIRGRALIINLPGKPAAIDVCLDAVFPAVPYCPDLIGAGRLETNPGICVSFRRSTPRCGYNVARRRTGSTCAGHRGAPVDEVRPHHRPMRRSGSVNTHRSLMKFLSYVQKGHAT